MPALATIAWGWTYFQSNPNALYVGALGIAYFFGRIIIRQKLRSMARWGWTLFVAAAIGIGTHLIVKSEKDSGTDAQIAKVGDQTRQGFAEQHATNALLKLSVDELKKELAARLDRMDRDRAPDFRSRFPNGHIIFSLMDHLATPFFGPQGEKFTVEADTFLKHHSPRGVLEFTLPTMHCDRYRQEGVRVRMPADSGSGVILPVNIKDSILFRGGTMHADKPGELVRPLDGMIGGLRAQMELTVQYLKRDEGIHYLVLGLKVL